MVQLHVSQNGTTAGAKGELFSENYILWGMNWVGGGSRWELRGRGGRAGGSEDATEVTRAVKDGEMGSGAIPLVDDHIGFHKEEVDW